MRSRQHLRVHAKETPVRLQQGMYSFIIIFELLYFYFLFSLQSHLSKHELTCAHTGSGARAAARWPDGGQRGDHRKHQAGVPIAFGAVRGAAADEPRDVGVCAGRSPLLREGGQRLSAGNKTTT